MTPGAVSLVLVACTFGVVSGFNDGGNLLASFTSARVISPRVAILLLLAVPVGPLLLGTAVARTVGVNIIDLPAQGQLAFVLIILLSICVVLSAWWLRIPASMTLALVGAMVGWALAGDHPSRINWRGLDRVVIGLPISVLVGLTLAFLLYSHFRQYLGGMAHARVIQLARWQMLTAALQSIAYGANDMEKTIGLIAVARAFSSPTHTVELGNGLPLVASYFCFIVGTFLGGWRIARRVAFGVVRVRPMQALIEQLAAGGTVATLALLGAPVSSTQTIDGALVGVGVGFRASAVRWGLVRSILGSWLITLPIALMAALVAHGAVRFLGWSI